MSDPSLWQLKLNYMGACALLGRLSTRTEITDEDRDCIKLALDDLVKLLPSSAFEVVSAGRGWSLEIKS